ncbi:uncharacterized protein LOC109831857 [Asparagus officinalis]|uniref:uncharacterized protein LOC109831857 n=1 Tax=Asparagus officinalis TaxID=4686 RepID=UPI00098E5136|nr:uncharacterized protein LOC109831857 [Asparagus officinalis]
MTFFYFKFHPLCGKLKITHLAFADDLLLLSRGDIYSIQKLYQCVKDFGEISGLEANPSKYAIFYGGIEEDVKASINSCLGFHEGSLLIKYLGVPLICKRLSYIDCTPLFKKITNQFQFCLKNQKLTFAGRLQIIKSVVYRLPLVAWDKICKEKKCGGLGIFSAKTWNLVLALKTICMKVGDSWMWKQLLKARDKAIIICGGIENLKSYISSCCKNSKIQLSKLYSAISLVAGNVNRKQEIIFSLIVSALMGYGITSWIGSNLNGRLVIGYVMLD